MRLDHKLREPLVLRRIHRVAHHAQDVEAGQNRLRELDVLRQRDRAIVPAADGIRGGDNRAPRMQGRHNPRLGNGNRLLLHGLMNRRAILIVHLVELIDQADAPVRQHERPALKRPLGGQRVAAHAGGQADGAGALARREDGPLRRRLDVLEDLRLGGARVAEQEDVDVAADVVGAVGFFWDAAEEGEGDSGLDVGVAVDAGGDGGDDLVDDVGVAGEGADGALVVLGQVEAGEGVVGFDDVVCFEDGAEDREAVAGVELGGVGVAVDGCDGDFFAGLGAVDEVPEEDDFAVAGEAAGGDGAGGFLERELLVVAVDGLFGVEGEGPAGLAVLAVGDAHFGVGFLRERAQRDVAFFAVEANVFELGEDAGAAGDDAADADEAVEVRLAQLPQSVVDGEVGDADVDFGVDAGVVGVVEESHVHGDLVEDLEDLGWCVGEEVG